MFKAVIFDMDGVLADSEPLYLEAINRVLALQEVHLAQEENEAIIGTTVEGTWQWLMAHFNLPHTRDFWIAQYDSAVLQILKEKVTPSLGLYHLLEELKRRALRLAVASSSRGEWIDAVLSTLKIKGEFQAIVSAEMVERGKPHPDIFLMAAKKLNTPPHQCIVMEDSPRGIEAAKRAGMTAIALLTLYTRHLDLSRADRVIESLADFDYGILDSGL
ncbi:MAG: HAD family phosphatase [Dehalococcoidia bacterium]